MSVSCVIVPVVVASWPTILPVLVGAAGALGFKVSKGLGENVQRNRLQVEGQNRATVDVKNASVLGEELGRDQVLEVEKGGVKLRFDVYSAGRCRVHVSGEGRSKAELERIGRQAADKVVQMYSYHRVMAQAQEMGYELVEEQVDGQGGIRIRLRRG